MTTNVFDEDIYTDDAIANPYPQYTRLREMGSAVYMSAHDVWAVARYDDVKAVLGDSETFSSARGVAVNDQVNVMGQGAMLFSDPPIHSQLRNILTRPLVPAAMESLRAQIEEAADELIVRLVAQGTFDGVVDLARFLPVSIVSSLVGLPDRGRANMLEWAAAGFDLLGPMNERGRGAMEAFTQFLAYVREEVGPGDVHAGSWAAALFAAADEGQITHQQANSMLIDYVQPSLDTTIFATSYLLLMLGRHPDQWQCLKQDRSLINNAVREAIRLESPIRGFTRYVTRDAMIGDCEVKAGSRVVALYASANRDERKWDDPERFDITRPGLTQQLGFGYGRHTCAGMHLAQLEIRSLLKAMLERIDVFEVGEPVLQLNNTLRGLAALPVHCRAVRH